ncbi:hypothetical protein NDU88_008722 [Pleurodeles waltl]|uniref:Uncharacterized protein n=1 Tax=Pleurodeles waltl TaxID=8319 RepID=A0AAV7PTX2_PLEWA|nr:hypothetical protein NDU88_008722 [Pleurodeles waltl]
MPPKGTKTALPALKGKQAKLGVVRSSGASDKLKLQREAKWGAPKKVREKSPVNEQEELECDKVATVRKKQKKRNAHSGPATHPHTSLSTKDLQWDYTNTPLEDEESKEESRRNQLACRKMQISIRRVAKTCSEFATRMGEAKIQISKLEDDAALQGAIGDWMKAQLKDIQ